MKSLRSAIDFTCVAAPKLFGGFCLVVLNLWLMKWLGPDSYGIYSLCLATLSLLSEGMFGAAIDLGVLRLAPLRLGNDTAGALRIEKAALKLKLQFAAAISVVLTLAAVPISHFVFRRPDEWPLIVVTCAAAAGTLCLSSALLHLQVREKFFRYGLLDALQIILKFGGIGIVLYFVGSAQRPVQTWQILIWFAIGPMIAAGVVATTIGKSILTTKATPSGGERGELLRFIRWFLLTLMVSALIAKLDVFLLSAYGTMNDVGMFSAGQTVALIPILLGLYLSVVFSPQVMPACRAGTFFSLLCRVQGVLFILSAVGYAVAFTYRDSITARLLPASFAASSDVIFILLPASLAGMTSFPLAVSFLMFTRPRFLVTVDLILFPFLILGYLLLIPPHGAVGAAWATAGYGIMKTAIAQVETFRCAGKSAQHWGNSGDTSDPATPAVQT